MMDEFLTQQKWYYMGPDETIYGPFSSHEMYVWLQHRYFNDNLQLKTDKDEQFYSLADWVQACGNQNPFLLPICSMESLLNDGNGMGVQRVPSVPVMGNGNCFSLSGTPSSTPTPAYGGGGNVFEPQHQPPLAGVPLQMVRASPPGPGGQIVFIPPPPAHGLFRPGNGQHPPTIFSPPNHPPPPFAMPQMSTIGAGSPFHPQQFVGSQRLENGGQGQPQLIQAPPLPAPAHPLHISLPYRPPASVLISQQQQRPPFGDATGKNNQKRQQETAPISSDSPDGGNMVTPYTQPPKIDKGLDTADAPWNKLVADKHVHKCVGPDMPMPAGQNSTGVQTDQIKISPSAAENHISQLLGGIRVVIQQQPHPSLPQQKNHHHHKEKASAGQNNNSQNSNSK